MPDAANEFGDSSAISGRGTKRSWQDACDGHPPVGEATKPGKRHSGGHPERSCHFLDLPVEIHEKIIGYLYQFSDVDVARRVCRRLHEAGTNVLRAGYQNLEMKFQRDVSKLQLLFDQEMETLEKSPPSGFPGNYFRGRAKVEDFCRSIFHMELVQSSFAIARATIGNLSLGNGDYDAELLDRCIRARNKIMRKPWEDFSSISFLKSIAKHINRIDDRIKLKRRSREDIFGLLSAIASLETLSCCVGSHASPPHLERYTGVDQENDHHNVVTLSMAFTLQGCWIGLEADEGYLAKSPEERVQDVFLVLRELVWNINYEQLVQDLEKRLGRLVGTRQRIDYVARLVPVQLRAGHDESHVNLLVSPWFEALDVDDERVIYYGHIFPIRRDITTCWAFPPQQVKQGDKVKKVPTRFGKGVVDVKFEITCCEALLPRGLCRKATVSESTSMSDASRPPLLLRIESHEDANRRNTRCYDFACYAGESTGLSDAEPQLISADAEPGCVRRWTLCRNDESKEARLRCILNRY